MDYSKQNQMGQPPQAAPGYPAQQTYPVQQQPYPVQQQPYPGAAPYGMVAVPQDQPWSTGLCDCFDDINNCCLTWWCPCITFGQIAEIVDRGATSCGTAGGIYILIAMLTGCQCIYSCTYRSRMRAENGLQEAPCADCCVHCWCEACALCQMARELKNRGWDLNLGYRLNLERRGGMIQMPTVPPPQQGMMR